MENKKTSETLLLRDETANSVLRVHVNDTTLGSPSETGQPLGVVITVGRTDKGAWSIALDYRQCLMLYKFLESYV